MKTAMENVLRRALYKSMTARLDATKQPREKRTYVERLRDIPGQFSEYEIAVFTEINKEQCDFVDELIAEMKAKGEM